MYYGSIACQPMSQSGMRKPFYLQRLSQTLIMLVAILRSNASWQNEETSRKKKKEHCLARVNVFSRFRLRVIFQNFSNYIVLFVGIVFANSIIIFDYFCPLYLTTIRQTFRTICWPNTSTCFLFRPVQ